MNQLKEYRRFVRHVAPASYKKKLERAGIGMLGWLGLAFAVARYTGVSISLPAQVPTVVCVALLLITYLPHPALLLACWGLISVVWAYLESGELGGYGILILGLDCFFNAHKLWKAFREYRKTGACSLQEKSDVILGPATPVGQERFMAQDACPACGGPMEVIGTKYSRFALRMTNHSADWRWSCPNCGHGAVLPSRRAKRLALDNGAFVSYRRAEFIDWWLAGAILSLAVMIVGLAASILIGLSGRAIHARDIRSPRLSVNQQFIGEELSIIDGFALEAPADQGEGEVDPDSATAIYMVAALENEQGIFLLPVEVLADKDIFRDCLDFAADTEAAVLVRNIHGFVDRMRGDDLVSLYLQTAQAWADATPDAEIIREMVIYWDGETAPSDDGDILAAMRLAAAAGAILAAVFFWLDNYANSEKRAARIQARYSARQR